MDAATVWLEGITTTTLIFWSFFNGADLGAFYARLLQFLTKFGTVSVGLHLTVLDHIWGCNLRYWRHGIRYCVIFGERVVSSLRTNHGSTQDIE
ncbi:hypothetical protein LIER_40385 [Lithospermum erythrorhizon]|uniref:Uncharacterized protein n=1 Tax=Lithospermum erythrorhizon TaxID=34254 RepID=A0AAV3QWB5_LITER